MDQACRVHGSESIARTLREAQHALETERRAREHARDVLADEVLHDEVGHSFRSLARVDDLHDVRVANGRERPQLALKAFDTMPIAAELGAQELHREALAEPIMANGVDLAHAPAAEAMEHLVRGREHHPGPA